jgi:glutathione synthase
VDQVARDPAWLNSVLQHTASSDPFTHQLLQVFNSIPAEKNKQTLSLGIIRSDYMLHEVDGDSRSILQVEINTIASSFGSLSTKISQMHKTFNPKEDIPINYSLEYISQAIAMAHSRSTELSKLVNPVVVMVVQPNERNFADQRLLQFELLEKYGIQMVRLSLSDIEKECVLYESTGLLSYGTSSISVVYVSSPFVPT